MAKFRIGLTFGIAATILAAQGASVYAAPAGGVSALAVAPVAAEGFKVASVQESGDVIRMYLIKHELKFNLKGTGASLDGKAIKLGKPITKDGRVYIPLSTLKASGAAQSVIWDAKSKQVRITMRPEVMPTWSNLTFRVGSDKVFKPDGTVLEGASFQIPKPFMKDGSVYVPVKALTLLNLSVATVNGVVTWKWSDKKIDRLRPEWETDQEQATFTVLAEQGLNEPSMLDSQAGGAFYGPERTLVGKGIVQGGRVYNRYQFTTLLKPGPNPMMSSTVSFPSTIINVTRKVADPAQVPIKMTSDGKAYAELDAPVSGYLKIRAGESITVSGKLLHADEKMTQVTVQAERYIPESARKEPDVTYQSAESKVIAIKNNVFSGAITLSKPGTYTVFVKGPSSTTIGENNESAGTEWAELVVEVT